MQIGQRRGLLKFDVASPLHATGRDARDQNGEILVVMHVGIAHTTAVQVKGMIQK